MSATGYIQVRAYTSTARFPLENVGHCSHRHRRHCPGPWRLTDRNGLIAPIELPVPDKSESQAPEAGEKPYTTVNLYARLKGYEQIEAENLQVFADTITNQNLEMIPLSEFPNQWDQTEIFNTPPQNL